MSKFQYTINFDDTNNKTFEINVDEKTFIIKDDDNVAAPEWTLLANNKCTHCPYNTDKVKYCPVAKTFRKLPILLVIKKVLPKSPFSLKLKIECMVKKRIYKLHYSACLVY